jgi:hypothetical protein
MVALLANSIINNGMEYVYQLNLPSLKDVLKNDLIDAMDNCYNPILKINPADYFTDEILTIKNLNWANGIAFKKPNLFTGPIHIDGYGDNTGNDLIWAINWIHGGEGGMQYWSRNYTESLSYDVAGLARLDVKATGQADKNYKTDPGKVYLINASIPHLAYNTSMYSSRYAVSIRATNSQLNWQQVVDLFSDLII